GLLRPGQFAKVRAPLEIRRGALLVVQSAVQQLQDIYQLAVITPADTVEIRSVKVGPRLGPRWLIEEGLRPGDRVVVAGLLRVRAGERVRPRIVSWARRMSRFFINRPVVAMVISILITIAGLVTFRRLPVAQFPDIAPPEISIRTMYVGADALT